MMDRASYLPKLYIAIYRNITLLFAKVVHYYLPIWYIAIYRLKVAATLKKNIVFGKNSPLRKTGPKCISALIGMFSTASFDAAELVNMLMCA
jgi:hypothetical protein